MNTTIKVKKTTIFFTIAINRKPERGCGITVVVEAQKPLPCHNVKTRTAQINLENTAWKNMGKVITILMSWQIATLCKESPVISLVTGTQQIWNS